MSQKAFAALVQVHAATIQRMASSDGLISAHTDTVRRISEGLNKLGLILTDADGLAGIQESKPRDEKKSKSRKSA